MRSHVPAVRSDTSQQLHQMEERMCAYLCVTSSSIIAVVMPGLRWVVQTGWRTFVQISIRIPHRVPSRLDPSHAHRF